MEQLQPYIDSAIRAIAPVLVELVLAVIAAATAWLVALAARFRARVQAQAVERAVVSVEDDYAPFPGPEKQARAAARVASELPRALRPRAARARKLIDKAVAAKNAEHGKRWPQQ